MPNIIKIKRSAIHDAPTELAWGEMGWSDTTQKLYIGTVSGSVVPVVGDIAVSPDILLPTTENLIEGMFVNFYSDGTNMFARRADASLGIAGQVHGYVIEDFAAFQVAKVYTRRGLIIDIPGLTAGFRYYLSGTEPGKLTLTPTEASEHVLQLVGNSVANNKLEFLAEDAIVRI